MVVLCVSFSTFYAISSESSSSSSSLPSRPPQLISDLLYIFEICISLSRLLLFLSVATRAAGFCAVAVIQPMRRRRGGENRRRASERGRTSLDEEGRGEGPVVTRKHNETRYQHSARLGLFASQAEPSPLRFVADLTTEARTFAD